MSVLVSLSRYFYTVCCHLANGIKTTKDSVQYIAQVNYDLVAAVFSFISYVAGVISMAVEQCVLYLKEFVLSMTNFFESIVGFVDSIFLFLFKIVFDIYTSVVDAYDSFVSFNSFVVSSLSNSTVTFKNSVLDVYGSVASVISWGIMNCGSSIVAFCMSLASLGQFCVSVVSGTWLCLGFILSSIAYFPVYCFECIESLKQQFIHNIVHTFTAMPKETYLVIICFCLSYFTLSNGVRYLSSHGIKLFSSRLRSRRRRPNVDWQFDRDFESDFEDLYGNDASDGDVWMVPGVTIRQENNPSDDDTDRSGSSDSETVDDDDDLSDDDDEDDDGDSEDGYTVISDDSDSDTSLNSQTLSTESSEHEIEVSLPVVDDRYSLRSRSSTPSSSFPQSLSSPEEFEREMEREKDKRKCVVCQDQVKSVLIMPCRHMCVCVLCADQIVRSQTIGRRVCPLCRTKIQKVMNVYV